MAGLWVPEADGSESPPPGSPASAARAPTAQMPRSQAAIFTHDAEEGAPQAFTATRFTATGFAQGAKSAALRLLDLALPPLCLVCHHPIATAGSLCTECWSRLALIERPFCERLGIPFAFDLGPGALSADAIAQPPRYDRARAAVIFNDGAKQLIHALKYRDRLEMAEVMARMMARAGRDVLADADLLVPVPLHPWRLWRRRFNQAALLAARVGRLSGVATDPLALTRVRATAHQVGLDVAARAANVAGAFQVPPACAGVLTGRRIVLVDDVLTSGATVDAAVKALRKAKPARVDVLVFARVVNHMVEPI